MRQFLFPLFFTAIKKQYKLAGRVVNKCCICTVLRGKISSWDPSATWHKPQPPLSVVSSAKKP